MVVPQFPKRADAKNAVCLAALSAGVGTYVRAVSVALEGKLSPEKKALVYESILPLLNSEYAKFWPNKLPEMFEYTKDRDGTYDLFVLHSDVADDLYAPASPACGCIMTLKLTEQPGERETRSWTVPADFRNRNDAKVAVVHAAFEQGAIEFLRFRGESPPEGYKVELPPPRESKKAKRKALDGTENEGEPPKKPKLLSQAEQFLASTLSSKSTEPRASGPRPSGSSRPRPSTLAEPIFLPRPGYIDPKPEPGELPSELPPYQPEYPPTSTLRWPTTQPSFDRPTREYPPHPTAESSSSFYHRGRSNDPRGTYSSYGTREHGHHQFELGDSRYDGPSVYASDPYYVPPPAPHTEPWHARPPISGYPEEGGAYSRSYRDIDYGRGYDYGYDYGYGYERDRYTPPPPPPPPAGPGGPGYAGYERSGYDYDYNYAHEGSYSRPAHPYMQYPQPPPQPVELTSAPRRWVPAPAPQPRVWEPGPHVAEMDARRSGTSEPRPRLSGSPSEPPKPSFTRASSEVEAGLVLESTLVSASVSVPPSASVSSSSTPASSNTHAQNTASVSSKEELLGVSAE